MVPQIATASLNCERDTTGVPASVKPENRNYIHRLLGNLIPETSEKSTEHQSGLHDIHS